MNGFFRRYWKKLLWALCLLALAGRFGGLFAALDYDEIWTLEFFSGKPISYIFTALALPNNHCLNSLFVKIAVDAGLPLWGIRLHSWIAGALSVLLMAGLGARLGGSRGAGFWSGFFLLCSAPCAVYAAQARGYGLQLFFLLLAAWGMTVNGQRRWRFAAPAAVAVGGLGSVLTLPTSVLFLGALVLGNFIVRPRLPGKVLGSVLIAGALFCLVWYGVNLKQFQSGQQFGTPISGAGGMVKFAFVTLEKLIPLEWCLFLIPGVLRAPRRLGPAVLCGMTAVLLSAFITRGGPVRVYIPLAAGAALLCGIGADRLCRFALRYGQTAVIGASAAALALGTAGLVRELPRWRSPDWYALFEQGARLKEDTLAVYSGTGGFPVMWNNRPRSIEENAARIAGSAGLKRLFLFSGDHLNGVDLNFSEAQIRLATPGTPGEGGSLFALEKTDAPVPGDELLIITCDWEKALDTAFAAELAQAGDFLRLNIFFEDNPVPGRLSVIRGGRLKKAGVIDWKNLPGQVNLFRLKPITKERL